MRMTLPPTRSVAFVVVAAGLAGCSVAVEQSPIAPLFPAPLDAEVQRAQSQIGTWVAGACSPAETALLTEDLALHAAAVSGHLPPDEMAMVEARSRQLDRGRVGFSLRCRKRIDAWPLGPVRRRIASPSGLRPA